jgi:histidine ammonia-lyase
MNASQAIEFRRPAKTSPYLEDFLASFRKVVPFVEEDIIMYQAIDRAVDFIRQRDFVRESVTA